MSNQSRLSLAQKERIYRGKLKGHTLPELATEVGCTIHCARKWCGWVVTRVWVFLTEDEEELVRRPLKDLDVQTLTGLDPAAAQVTQPVQLTLPFLVA